MSIQRKKLGLVNSVSPKQDCKALGWRIVTTSGLTLRVLGQTLLKFTSNAVAFVLRPIREPHAAHEIISQRFCMDRLPREDLDNRDRLTNVNPTSVTSAHASRTLTEPIRAKPTKRKGNDSRMRRVRALVLEQLEPLSLPATFLPMPNVLDGDPGSLRDAIETANQQFGIDTIELSSGTYTIARTGADGGDFDLTETVVIRGAGSEHTIIDAGMIDRHFELFGTANLILSGVTLTNGHVSGRGGSISSVGGDLDFQDVKLINNHADGPGGAVFLDNSLSLFRDSVFEFNSSGTKGGAIVNHGSTGLVDSQFVNNTAPVGGAVYDEFSSVLRIISSTFVDNSAVRGGAVATRDDGLSIETSQFISNRSERGGALDVDNGSAVVEASSFVLNVASFGTDFFSGLGGAVWVSNGELSLTNSTISQNASTISGAAVLADFSTDITISHSTIVGNESLGAGSAAVDNRSADPISIDNSIFAAEHAATPELNGEFVSGGYNIVAGDGGAASGLIVTDQVNTDPALGPLGYYGTSTAILPLTSSSPGIGAGNPTSPPLTDQHGRVRDDHPDVGAYEVAPHVVEFRLDLVSSTDDSITDLTVGDRFWLNVVVADDRPVPVGTYAAYVNIHFDESIVVPSGTLVHGPHFQNATDGTIGAGVVQRFGAVRTDFELPEPGTSSGDLQLGSIEFTAVAPGAVTFMSSSASNSVIDATLLLSHGTPVSESEISRPVAALMVQPLSLVAVDDTATTTEDDNSLIIDVLANDQYDGTPTITVPTQSTSGAVVSLTPENTIAYDPTSVPSFQSLPANTTTTDTFSYSLNGSVSATVTITITGVNDEPIASDDAATTTGSQPVIITVLSNDSDLDHELTPLTILAPTTSANGRLVVVDGTIEYTPNDEFFGTDTFTYTIQDTELSTATASVTVVVESLHHNATSPLDVNADGQIVPLDVLLIINEVNLNGARLLPTSPPSPPTVFFDTDLDGFVSASDAIQVIDYLNALADPALLLQDNFDGDFLSRTKWRGPEPGPGSFLGRTQLDLIGTPKVVDGVLRLPLRLYNPSGHDGDSFLGSQITTIDEFDLASGIAIEVDARLANDTPAGIVGGIFTFDLLNEQARQEIDVELLSNSLHAGQSHVIANVFDDLDDFSSPGNFEFVPTPRPLDEFSTYRIEVRPDRITWFVDDVLVREVFEGIPTRPAPLYLNAWVPNADFGSAFSDTLQPSNHATDDQAYFFEVGRVEIRELTV